MNETSRFTIKIITGSLLLLLAIIFTSRLDAREPDWNAYTYILKKSVFVGKLEGVKLNRVNYNKIKNDPRWSGVVKTIETFPTSNLANYKEKLAFYINAYNILTIDLIIKRGQPASIRNLGNNIWKQKNVRLNNQITSLDHIEHRLIRPLGDGRIHFAIVCASISCPDLRNEAYSSDRIYVQLYSQASRFLRNSDKGLKTSISSPGVVHVSKIFDWFAADFKSYGGVTGFLKKYRKDLPVKIEVKTDLPYNWNLNR